MIIAIGVTLLVTAAAFILLKFANKYKTARALVLDWSGATLKTNSYPKPWAFVGRATPEDALQSLLYGQSQGDLKIIEESYSPETWAIILDYVRQHPKEYPNGLAAANINQRRNVRAFTVLKEKRVSEHETYLQFIEDGGMTTTNGQPHVSTLHMGKIGGEWKMK